MTVTFEEAKKRIFQEATGNSLNCANTGTLTSETLGTGDVLSDASHLIPYLVWNEINIYPPRRRVFRRAVLETTMLVGAAGTKIYIPVYDQDEFTAQTDTEQEIDHNGYTKSKPSPEEVELCIGDVVYNATKISDILREDSPSLGWVQASLQMMGFSIQHKIESDIEAVLFNGGVAGGNITGAATAGQLSWVDIIDAKTLMSTDSFYDMGQPFLLFINPEQEGDLLKEFGPERWAGIRQATGNATAGYGREIAPTGAAAVGQPLERLIPLVGQCLPLVTEEMRDSFALVVVPPTHPYGPAAMMGWKRPIKAESWRDEQYGRDVWLLSTRYGIEAKRNEAISLISNC